MLAEAIAHVSSEYVQIVDGRVRLRLSASQLEAFEGCERKWAWRYLAGVEEPSKPSAVLGGQVHKSLENYLLKGELDFTSEVGYIAASGLEHLPKPGTPGMSIEQEFHFYGPSGHSYLGYKDIQLSPIAGVSLGAVIDHKTTSDFRWQKSADDLRKDIQATLYAVDFFRQHPNELQVELRWVYYLTRGSRKSSVTRERNGDPVVVSQQEVWDRFEQIEKTAERMAGLALKQPLELEANINHCAAFGGCPHQGRCNLSPFEKMRSYMEQNRLLAKLGKTNGASPVASTTPSATVPAPASANALLARLRSTGAPTATPVPNPAPVNPPEYQPPPTAPLTPPAASLVPTSGAQGTTSQVGPEGIRVAPGQAVSDPYALSPHLRPAGWAPPVPPQGSPGALATPGGVFAAPQAPSPAVAPEAPSGAPAAEPPKRRGRPPKAEVAAAQAELPAGQPDPLAQKSYVPLVPDRMAKIPVLYINCGPINVPVLDATVFISQAKSTIRETAGLADYRFADFGHGPGMLALATAHAVDACSVSLANGVRIDTTTPEGRAVLSELMSRAGIVVCA